MGNPAIVLGLAFFIVCLVFVLFHSLRIGRLSLLDWSVLAMGGVYGIGWSVVVVVTQSGNNPNWERWILPYSHLYFIHTGLAFVLLISMYLGWLIFGSLFHERGCETPKYRSNSPRNHNKRLLAAMWLLLIVSIVMQWVYTLAYGGFLGILEYSLLIRAGIFPIQNKFSFLRPFGGLAMFASFGFYGLWLSRYRRPAVWFGLPLAVVFSLYILYSWMGRLSMVVYFTTFVLGAILFRKPRPLLLVFTGFTGMVVGLIAVYHISIFLQLKLADNFISFLAKEISFPFVSFFGELAYGKELFRWFKDLFVAPLYLLPSSIWSQWQWVDNIGQVNTALILGAPKGEHGVTGAIPVDLLTLGIMQVSVFGVPVIGFLFGALLRLIQELLQNIPNKGVQSLFEAYLALQIAVRGVFYAQPTLLVGGNFPLIFVCFVIILFLKLPRIRRSKHIISSQKCEETI